MIQAIRRKPKMKPWTDAAAIIDTGMPKTRAASRTAISIPASADTHTRLFSTISTKNRVTTGRAETSVESGQEWNGS